WGWGGWVFAGPGGAAAPGEWEPGVGGGRVGAARARRPGGPVRARPRHVGPRRAAQRGGDRPPVRRVSDGHRGAAVQHDDVGVVPAEYLAGLVGLALALAGGRREAGPRGEPARPRGSPARRDRP